jgi:hypothetical protein
MFVDITAKYIKRKSGIFKTARAHTVAFSIVNTKVSKENTASILRVETFGSTWHSPEESSLKILPSCFFVCLQIALFYLHKRRPHMFLPKCFKLNSIFTFVTN